MGHFPINLFSIWWQKTQTETLKAIFTRKNKCARDIHAFTQFTQKLTGLLYFFQKIKKYYFNRTH